MKSYLGSFGKLVLTGALVFGMSAVTGAQYTPPASRQPMEIPVQYQPQRGQPDGPQQAPAQPAPSDAGAARISFIQGDVSTQHSGSSDWSAATLNTPVVSGDQISTAQNARAEIQLDHANIVRMSDRTTASVVSLARNQLQLQIGQGLVNFEVIRNNDASVEIQTPNVAIHPDSGEGSYRVLVNSDGETIVDVRKGSAEISTPQGSTRVERDQRITIQGNADNAQYQVSGAPGRDDWDRWNIDRDRSIEGARSWQHTNPNYTGSEDLDTYGHWSNVPDYGDVWFPSAGPDWVPYRDGRWVYEPYYGWTWVSYEPWGWAPYHYGRWFVYGGNWGWWPGPVYAGYQPIWAPAYVSFFGFGGGGWGLNVGFGFGGGFGNVGWLPCGPGDRFFPWYGRGINRVNAVNVYDIHNNFRGGLSPLREGPHAYSNVDRAFSDERVRAGISSMQSDRFGRDRVPMQQSRIEPGDFRKASVMTGANPVSPSRESFHPTDRPVSPNSIPSRGINNQRFFSSNNARVSPSYQGANGAGNFSRGGNVGPSPRENQSMQSSRPGWRTFTPPSGQSQSYGGGRGFEGQNAPQSRSNNSQYSAPPRSYQDNSRGGYEGNGSGRSTLNMQQPIVTPRAGGGRYGNGGYRDRVPSNPGSYSRSVPNAPSSGGFNGGGYRGAPSGRGSYNRPAPSAPTRGGSYGGGGNSRGGNSGGNSRSGSSGGGHDRH
jgi:hypothetical protein